jgi:hypothetical protein
MPANARGGKRVLMKFGKGQGNTPSSSGRAMSARRGGKKNGNAQMGMGSSRISGPTRITSSEIITREIPGFKNTRYRTILTYASDVVVTCGAGTAGTQVYSANGCYDPDITGTGHQPMAFDQLMLSYEHYCVLGAKITCTFRNADDNDSPSVGISLNAATTVQTDYTALRENGMIVREKLGFSASPLSIRTLVMKYDARKFHSIPSVLSDPDMQGTITANPVEQGYFHISVWNTESASTVQVYCSAFIEYDVVFTEPRKNGTSLEKQISALIRSDIMSREKGADSELKIPAGFVLVKRA